MLTSMCAFVMYQSGIMHVGLLPSVSAITPSLRNSAINASTAPANDPELSTTCTPESEPEIQLCWDAIAQAIGLPVQRKGPRFAHRLETFCAHAMRGFTLCFGRARDDPPGGFNPLGEQSLTDRLE
ncbi:hypothetical protein WR25_14996 [Diploscapter pachys]|uniref:Uncharacterized protein n=1 Tax=Diploscapter pachys TaxID=2018661 RepID=A0A2A2JZ90_9BILA|nr:hypothetical protein WR25_14996 [Diploscapter pachys]